MRYYIAIDLKSFYASVECVERGLDPLTANLVVADASRTDKTICLAVSPSLKAYGIGGRARLFEVKQRVENINYQRRRHGEAELTYITAPPQMAKYIEYSRRIYNIYTQFVAPEDIHKYSCDEVFMDITPYLDVYKQTPHQITTMIIHEVLRQTGITATAGIGTNLYLCKVAMDIVAKHLPADKDGVRIAELDEMSYREQLWSHRPLTDFWRVGSGTAKRLKFYGIETMGDIALASVSKEEMLYNILGVNAELLIDHAWGWEPCTMKDVKSYRPGSTSLSSGQVLTHPYTAEMAHTVVIEMTEEMILKLFTNQLLTDQITLTVSYDRENLSNPEIRSNYHGETHLDHYGREVPKHSHGTTHFRKLTNSRQTIIEAIEELYGRIVNKDLLIRRLTISVEHIMSECEAAKSPAARQLCLFDEAQDKEQETDRTKREKKLQATILKIKNMFGKNSILRGNNFGKGATQQQRNRQIGGHNA